MLNDGNETTLWELSKSFHSWREMHTLAGDLAGLAGLAGDLAGDLTTTVDLEGDLAGDLTTTVDLAGDLTGDLAGDLTTLAS